MTFVSELLSMLSVSMEKRELDSNNHLSRGITTSDMVPLVGMDNAAYTELSIFKPGAKALVFDYDGTLREFEDRPEDAVPTDELKRLLSTLTSQGIDIAIISSRRMDFLDLHFGDFADVQLIAERGLWIRANGTWNKDPNVPTQWMDEVKAMMNESSEEIPGSATEQKDASMAWHYRQAVSVDNARNAAQRLYKNLSDLGLPGVVVQMSDHERIVEVALNSLTKGRSLQYFLGCGENCHYTSVLVAGDGSADESMFETANHMFEELRAPDAAVTIKIDPNAGSTDEVQSYAKYRIRSPGGLRKMLSDIAERESARPQCRL